MRMTFYYCNPISKYKQLGNFILRAAEDSTYGHFAIGLKSKYSEEMVYEAVFPRFHKISKKEFLTHYRVEDEITWDVPNHVQFALLEFLESFVGVRYAIEQILFIGLAILFFPINMILKNVVLNGNKAIVCTELGSRVAEKFFGFMPKETHDKIGLSDMLLIGYRCKYIRKWPLQ